MKISIEMPDDAFERMVAGFAKTYNYQAKVTSDKGELVDNPQTSIQFWQGKMMAYAMQISTTATKQAMMANYEAKTSPLIAVAAEQALKETIVTVEPSVVNVGV